MNFNPQIKIEIRQLVAGGREVDVTDDFTEVGDLDYNYHSANKPLKVQCSINKSLGSNQNVMGLHIHNSPLLEKLRQNPQEITERLADNSYRIRVWAWHSNSREQQEIPNRPPVFVGDILDGFSFPSQDTTGSILQIQASSHSWLMGAGPMKKTWAAGTDYRTIVRDIFDFILTEKNYGYETFDATQKSAMELLTGNELAEKKLKSSFSISRNPAEVLNDITYHFDMVWGIENNVPYILGRKHYFDHNELNATPITTTNNQISAETGKIGVNSYGLFDFGAQMIYDSRVVLGRDYVLHDKPQIDSPNFVRGRLDSQSITLDNESGHKASMVFSYISRANDEIRLPRRRTGSSGRVVR